jgi:hypothetical protein
MFYVYVLYVFSVHTIYIYIYIYIYTLCQSQSMRNRWITTICDLIRPRGKSLGGVTLTAAIL